MKAVLVSLIAAIVLALWPYKALSKTLTVAVIDTGIDAASNDKLCKYGHKSFVPGEDPLVDYHGHGTHIAGLIRREAGKLNYCIVSIKFWSPSVKGKQTVANMVAAINYANNIKVDFINISGGGTDFSKEEFLAIKTALRRKATVVVAAGNEKSNLDDKCNYYPACYDSRIISVGNLEKSADFTNMDTDWKWLAIKAGMGHKLGTYETRRAPSSNYGKRVTRWEMGTNVDSTLPGGKHGPMTGTSQATGIATGKLIRERFL